jgi:hypothetical protein
MLKNIWNTWGTEMMLSFLAATVMAAGQEPAARMMQLLEPGGKPPRLSIYVREIPLDPPKFSPKLFGDPPQKWQFDWIASSFGPDLNAPRDPKTGEPQGRLRFRVFSQLKKRSYDHTVLVATQAIRMWDVGFNRYHFSHKEAVNDGIIDFYLCWGGEAGGEFTQGEDVLPNNSTKTVATVYIYDLGSFTKPVEMAREVAHEYGHAVLPPVGGYTTPEYWANGYLGEKFFMRILRDQWKRGLVGPNDTMGATLEQLNAWVKANVDPLVIKTASNPPSEVQLADRGKVGMDAYIGLVLYADTFFPPSVVTRSMMIMGSQDAKDYPDSLLRATQEMPKITLSIPPYLKDKPIWIPLGKGKVGQAQILKRSGDWAQVLPQAGGVVITTARG